MQPRFLALLFCVVAEGPAIGLAQVSTNRAEFQQFSDAFVVTERAKLMDKIVREGDRFDPVREQDRLRQRHEKVFGTSIPETMLAEFDRAVREAAMRPPVPTKADPITGKPKSPTETSPELFIAAAKVKFMEDIRADGDRFDVAKEFSKLRERYERNFAAVMPPELQNNLLGSADQIRTILAADRAAAMARMNAARTGAAATSTSVRSPSSGVHRGVHYPEGLPDWFQAHDRNHDGQVGLYEWERDRLAEFRRWDRNSDGFLEPLEVLQEYRKTTPAANDKAPRGR